MKACPVHRPDCRAIGARPARTCGLSGVEDAEFRHFNEQGKGGQGRDAWNGGEDREPSGEIGVGVDLLEDRGLDRRHLAFDLFEALGVLTLQRGAFRAFLRFLAAVRSFTKASRAR